MALRRQLPRVAFGLLHDKGSFYLNLSVAIDYGGATTDPQPAPNRGTTIKVDRATGKISYLAGGLRTPNGIGRGPGGGLFVTDNQGGWLPSSKLVHIEQDRFFHHRTNPPGPFDARPVTKPVLWLPQNEISNSPSTPMRLESGPFAGQMVFGDVTYGGLQRADLHKVGGAYQGAVFRHTQGLEAGITRVSTGPDGAIYAGGLGADGNWGQAGKLRFGLQKLTPNGKTAFDIRTMRPTADGFELTYTKPLSQETADRLTGAAYSVTQWRYAPTPAYGGPKADEEALTVTAAKLSKDRRKVTLTIPGLKTDRVSTSARRAPSPRPAASSSGPPRPGTPSTPAPAARRSRSPHTTPSPGGCPAAPPWTPSTPGTPVAASSTASAPRAPPPASTSWSTRRAPTTSACATPTAPTPSPGPRP